MRVGKPAFSAFWKRLDQPGHDHCHYFELAEGWRLEGMAVFQDGRPCHFRYEVETGPDFATRRARVRGWLGEREIDLRIEAASGRRWRFDGRLVKEVEGCPDLDLGFTPATNTLAIRRLGLEVGARAEAPAAYLEFPDLTPKRLEQSYHRLAAGRYAYESPAYRYAETLEVLPTGVVARYPGIFERIEG